MTTKNKLTAHIQYAFDYETKNRICLSLLTKSDAFLKEVGVSRALLEQGVDAWPWASDSDTKELKVA